MIKEPHPSFTVMKKKERCMMCISARILSSQMKQTNSPTSNPTILKLL